MKWVVLIILIIGALALLRKIAELKGWIPEGTEDVSTKDVALPSFEKTTLMTEYEQKLYFKLVEAVPNYIVFAQVRLADIVEIKKGKNRQAWQNKINMKSIDFVLCDKSTTVKACIELDDNTHKSEDRIKADADKDAALGAAGIPILRYTQIPPVEVLRRQIGLAQVKKAQ